MSDAKDVDGAVLADGDGVTLALKTECLRKV